MFVWSIRFRSGFFFFLDEQTTYMCNSIVCNCVHCILYDRILIIIFLAARGVRISNVWPSPNAWPEYAFRCIRVRERPKTKKKTKRKSEYKYAKFPSSYKTSNVYEKVKKKKRLCSTPDFRYYYQTMCVEFVFL